MQHQRRLFVFILLTFAFLAMVIARDASAHPLDLGFLFLENDGAIVRARLELNPAIAARAANSDQALTQLLKQARLSSAGASCNWAADEKIDHVNAEKLIVSNTAQCPDLQTSLKIDLPFLRLMPEGFNLIVKAHLNDQERMSSADPKVTAVSFHLEEKSYSFSKFLQLGIAHIGVSLDEWRGPSGYHLPLGIDHILFLLALVLAGENFIDLLKMVTGFTIGHTISVALAVFHFVNLSGHIVEPLIALTIALVSIETVIGFKFSHKWKVTFGIGLIHGLAFAEALVDLKLAWLQEIEAIVGFNVGVELGQALIIALLFPIVSYFRRVDSDRKLLIRACAGCIAGISIYWMIQRI